jgi:serine phosphatase RsbU (regulator of sigma subunit)
MGIITRVIFSGLLLSLFFQLNAQKTPAEVDAVIKDYNERAEKFIQEGDLREAAKYLNKSAYLLQNNGRNNEAIAYFQRLLEINQELNNQNGLMIIHNNIGMIYSDLEQFDDAVPHFKNGLKLSKKLGKKVTTVTGLTNLAVALQGLDRYKESNKHIEEAILLAKELNNLRLLRSLYGLQYENYDKLGDSERARESFNLYLSFDKQVKKDEMMQVKRDAKSEVSKAYAEKQHTEQELEVKKEELKITTDSLQKAEELTEEQKLLIELKESQLREERLKSRYIIRVLIIISLFAVVLTFLFILIIRANKKIKNQKNILDRQNKNIKASIRYAETIQKAILPEESLLKTYFESFLIFRPKDIVSGDFYWFSKARGTNSNKGSLFVAVVDCTGHGVPGAFMSMIGNSLLNEMINERRMESPEEILEQLNFEIRKALRQDKTDNTDGMDMSLCRFDKISGEELKVVFAGAKRNLLIVNNGGKGIEKLKGDRKSIGGIEEKVKRLKFSNKEAILNKGTRIYLSTDGIIDQNGPDRKRFGSKKLEELLEETVNLSVEEQKEKINQELNNFMKNEEQRDDITLIGLKVL